MFDDNAVLNPEFVQSKLQRFVTKHGTDKNSIDNLKSLSKEEFWQKLPSIIEPVFKIPGVKHLEKKKYYKSSQILASQSYCIVDVEFKTLLECSKLLNVLYEKAYTFDPLIGRLMDTAAVLFLHHDIKIVFSNNYYVLNNAGYVEGARIVGIERKIIVNINPSLAFLKTNVNTNTISGLDNVYHHVFSGLSKYVNAYNPNVFYQTQYDRAVSATLSNLENDNTNGKLGWFNWFEIKEPLEICKRLLERELSPKDFIVKDLDRIYIMKHFTEVCKSWQLNSVYTDIYADVYALIVDGLESDRGVRHNKLAYLQPMVSFIKDYFEPSHILYQSRLCSSNKVVECHRSGDVTMFSVVGLEGLEDVTLRGTVIDE